MKAEYTVVADTARSLVRLTMSGFFGIQDIEDMRFSIIKAINRLACGPNQHDTLCDIRGMMIQSQDSVEAFQSLVGSDPIRSRHLVFVTGATLARLQAKRLTNRDGVKFFSDMDEADAWVSATASKKPLSPNEGAHTVV